MKVSELTPEQLKKIAHSGRIKWIAENGCNGWLAENGYGKGRRERRLGRGSGGSGRPAMRLEEWDED